MDAADDTTSMASFHAWDAAQLVKLGKLLGMMVRLQPDGFVGVPDVSDSAFWSDAAAQLNEGRAQLNPDSRIGTKELAMRVTAELESLKISAIYPGRDLSPLFLADISSGMSRLAHAILGTRQLVLIGGDKVLGACSTWDRRPRLSGTTCWIDTAQPLAAQLLTAVRFARHAPTVVAAPDGNGVGAVVCAAIVASREGLSSLAALCEIEKRRGSLTVELDDQEELDKFCHSLLLAEFELCLGVPTRSISWSGVLSPPSLTASPRLSPVKLKLSGVAAASPDCPMPALESPVRLKLSGVATAHTDCSTPTFTASRPREYALSPVKRGTTVRQDKALESSMGVTHEAIKRRKTAPELDDWKLESEPAYTRLPAPWEL